ncbi:ATP-binding protein [Streptomyces sp. NPDC001698]|uniref:ATP-binding protein n=1 Tax=Streptomyces sp. NPDC001698 TaxID=3364601 RepID=UPI0036AA8742
MSRHCALRAGSAPYWGKGRSWPTRCADQGGRARTGSHGSSGSPCRTRSGRRPRARRRFPFEAEAANLFFQLISNRYERASVIVTSNKPFGRWGETFGDETVAAAMIDRLVHHAEVHSLKGESYRMRGRELGRTSTTSND